MKMHLKIHGNTDARWNHTSLEEYAPVDGRWELDGSSEDRSFGDIVSEIKRWLHVNCEVSVKLFHADGREITGPLPSEGTFVATRI